jgi:hypothetical protein
MRRSGPGRAAFSPPPLPPPPPPTVPPTSLGSRRPSVDADTFAFFVRRTSFAASAAELTSSSGDDGGAVFADGPYLTPTLGRPSVAVPHSCATCTRRRGAAHSHSHSHSHHLPSTLSLRSYSGQPTYSPSHPPPITFTLPHSVEPNRPVATRAAAPEEEGDGAVAAAASAPSFPTASSVEGLIVRGIGAVALGERERNTQRVMSGSALGAARWPLRGQRGPAAAPPPVQWGGGGAGQGPGPAHASAASDPTPEPRPSASIPRPTTSLVPPMPPPELFARQREVQAAGWGTPLERAGGRGGGGGGGGGGGAGLPAVWKPRRLRTSPMGALQKWLPRDFFFAAEEEEEGPAPLVGVAAGSAHAAAAPLPPPVAAVPSYPSLRPAVDYTSRAVRLRRLLPVVEDIERRIGLLREDQRRLDRKLARRQRKG